MLYCSSLVPLLYLANTFDFDAYYSERTQVDSTLGLWNLRPRPSWSRPIAGLGELGKYSRHSNHYFLTFHHPPIIYFLHILNLPHAPGRVLNPALTNSPSPSPSSSRRGTRCSTMRCTGRPFGRMIKLPSIECETRSCLEGVGSHGNQVDYQVAWLSNHT